MAPKPENEDDDEYMADEVAVTPSGEKVGVLSIMDSVLHVFDTKTGQRLMKIEGKSARPLNRYLELEQVQKTIVLSLALALAPVKKILRSTVTSSYRYNYTHLKLCRNILIDPIIIINLYKFSSNIYLKV